jgi:hypothetical protein|tara:strand:+ start:357 stop:644 length:288 start_codon:yes stop_codon:yes gene_type:complete
MRKSKERKHELKRISTANKIAKKDKLKNRISDNVVMRIEMDDNFQIIENIIYTFIPKETAERTIHCRMCGKIRESIQMTLCNMCFELRTRETLIL